jgi:hypothetical protein
VDPPILSTETDPKRIECIGLENSTILEKKQNKQTTKGKKKKINSKLPGSYLFLFFPSEKRSKTKKIYQDGSPFDYYIDPAVNNVSLTGLKTC